MRPCRPARRSSASGAKNWCARPRWRWPTSKISFGGVSIAAAVANAGRRHPQPPPSRRCRVSPRSPWRSRFRPRAQELARTCMHHPRSKRSARCATDLRASISPSSTTRRGEQFAIGYNVGEAPARRRATTTCSRPKRAPRRLHCRSPRARSRRTCWFSLGRVQTQTRDGAGAAVLERLDVRVPDAAIDHAGRGPAALIAESTASPSRSRSPWGREQGVPWAFPSAGYFLTDAGQNYHYRAFGTPGLGLAARPSRRIASSRRTQARSPCSSRRARRRATSPTSAAGWWSRLGYYEADRLHPGASARGRNGRRSCA